MFGGFVVIALLLMGNDPPSSGAADATCVARTGEDVQWVRVSPDREHASIDRWCAGVGRRRLVSATGQRRKSLPGRSRSCRGTCTSEPGDIDALVGDLRSGRLTGGAPVAGVRPAAAGGVSCGPRCAGARRRELGRGRAAGGSRRHADRRGHRRAPAGTARRSTCRRCATAAPASRNEIAATPSCRRCRCRSVTAIELPLERQRRVALAGPRPARTRRRGRCRFASSARISPTW